MDTGIYFGLPEDEYRADPALSRGGLVDLMQSPLTYWTNSVHNPHRPPPEKETEEMRFGTACHVRILQGREEFDRQYYPSPDERDFPRALRTGDQLRSRCKMLKVSSGGSLVEMSERIRELDKEVQLWTEIKAACDEAAAGRIQITRVQYDAVERAAEAIENSPEIVKYVRSGWPEVSIFWNEEVETASRKTMTVPMKARLDYFSFSKGEWLVPDIKTFGMKTPRPVDIAAKQAALGYGLQAVTYTMGLRAIANALDEDRNAVHLPIGVDPGIPKAIRFFFLMVRSGNVPDAFGYEYGEELDGERMAYWRKVEDLYVKLLRQYADAVCHFGYNKPWVTPAGLVPLRDEDCPLWAL